MGRYSNASEAKGNHKGCVLSGGEAYAMGSPSALILVGLRLIHEAVTEFLRVLLLKQS